MFRSENGKKYKLPKRKILTEHRVIRKLVGTSEECKNQKWFCCSNSVLRMLTAEHHKKCIGRDRQYVGRDSLC